MLLNDAQLEKNPLLQLRALNCSKNMPIYSYSVSSFCSCHSIDITTRARHSQVSPRPSSTLCVKKRSPDSITLFICYLSRGRYCYANDGLCWSSSCKTSLEKWKCANRRIYKNDWNFTLVQNLSFLKQPFLFVQIAKIIYSKKKRWFRFNSMICLGIASQFTKCFHSFLALHNTCWINNFKPIY